ncbi:MAG TPA: sigma-70 family RNA polymerase sigma factor, partial [Holophagaceae bacterium]|nr:sigma-70 family RNA polymerase sigma factor [Holophagaceae bacterium]
VQRTFLKAFERLGQLRAPEAARSWLITILRHERASDLRRQARFEVLEEEPADEGSEAAEEGLDPQLLHALPAALDCLQEVHREILLLRFQQDLSYESIGASLEIPVGTVMSRLHRAKAQLRRLLEALAPSRHGGTP